MTVEKLKERSAQTLAENTAPVSPKTTAFAFGEGNGDRYRVRLIAYGEGSSAHYPEAMLRRDGAEAWPVGTRMRANHDGLCEAGGDIRRVIARTLTDAEPEADGLYADIYVAEEWSSYVREFGDVIGLSISAAAELEPFEADEDTEYDDYGNPLDEDGNPIKPTVARVLTMEESPYNSVDFVEAPGANGRIMHALESAREALPKVAKRKAAEFAGKPFEKKLAEHVRVREDQKKEIDLDEDKVQKIVEAAISKAVSPILESLTPKAPEPEKISLETVSEAVVAAGLSTPGRKAVYEAIERGVDHADAIEAQKAYEKELRESFESARTDDIQPGFVVSEGAAKASVDDEYDRIEKELIG